MTYSKSPSYRLIHGDCLDVMRGMDAGSVDAVVTDPPYGLSFMGKGWDHGVPGEPFWVEALRVAKPGAHLLAFGGTRTFHRLTCAIEDAGWEVRDCLSWLYGSGFPKSHNGAWGGTALKPAWEPIILARKSLIGTVAANFAAHGTGALNIDATRIEGAKADGSGQPPLKMGGTNHRPFHDNATPRDFDTTTGRWPANVCLDETAAAMLDEQSGVRESGARSAGDYGLMGYGSGGDVKPMPTLDGSFGGASRFFYTAKASRSEREAGLTGPIVECQSGMGGAMPTDDNGNERDRFKARARNTHPTVKPVDLMRWLVRLVTPTSGTVLDPFTGSGSTGVACAEEGCHFIGIEREAEYIAIAEARLKHAAEQGRLDFAPREQDAITAHFAWSAGVTKDEAAKVVGDAIADGKTVVDIE